jgi:hypothetical protein
MAKPTKQARKARCFPKPRLGRLPRTAVNCQKDVCDLRIAQNHRSMATHPELFRLCALGISIRNGDTSYSMAKLAFSFLRNCASSASIRTVSANRRRCSGTTAMSAESVGAQQNFGARGSLNFNFPRPHQVEFHRLASARLVPRWRRRASSMGPPSSPVVEIIRAKSQITANARIGSRGRQWTRGHDADRVAIDLDCHAAP